MKTPLISKSVFLMFISVILMAGIGCGQNNRKEVGSDKSSSLATKVINEQLIKYIDELSVKLAGTTLDDTTLTEVTNRFSRYFPVVIYKGSDSVPEHTVMVTRSPSAAADEPERISLSLPQAIGAKLTVKELTDHFGPLAPEGILAREHQTPFPFIISLKKHLKLPGDQMSLHISASDYPESKNNQIKSIEIININPQ